MEIINVVLVDDHVLVRDGIRALLEDQNDIKVINEASNGKDALQIIESITTPIVLIVDIRMPEMTGIELVTILKEKHTEKDIKTLVLSMHDSEEYVVQSIQAGADGYLLKGSSKEEFLKALHKIASGDKYFTGDVSDIIMNNFVNGKTTQKTNTTSKKSENPFKLTKRETQILQLVLQLKNNKDIGEELKISKRTVEVHRFNLMKKLNVKNIMELNQKANEYNLI
ncbi:response regulator [Tenacibaculum jejuense]|uniref:Two-component system response regulatory protein, LuxR family n=1 Tax=Tenacibaculum jejuense TaxID=584609 RepID=A0A238UAS8_9FLAO|nr:response regulator transcription factor [Tenacibaculum jejuense]SNR16279.1 Two-component system response regulatory protein, LuxR family [Tenacibaculum jejuense]